MFSLDVTALRKTAQAALRTPANAANPLIGAGAISTLAALAPPPNCVAAPARPAPAGRRQSPASESVALLRLDRLQREACRRGGWSAAEIDAFQRRGRVFSRRGYCDDDLDSICEALALRDRGSDDRRLCIECRHLDDRGRCLRAAMGRLDGFPRRFDPLLVQLQRCHGFTARADLVLAEPQPVLIQQEKNT